MKKEIKSKDFIPQPEYTGGPKAMAAFIHSNLKYPKDAFDKKVEGMIVLKAEINFRGDVIDTKLISGIGHGCDEEAMRVVRLLKFKVQKVRNIKISYFKTFNIQFKLPVPQTNQLNISQTNQVNYILTKEEKKPEKSVAVKIDQPYIITIKMG
jgi:protein TonB